MESKIKQTSNFNTVVIKGIPIARMLQNQITKENIFFHDSQMNTPTFQRSIDKETEKEQNKIKEDTPKNKYNDKCRKKNTKSNYL